MLHFRNTPIETLARRFANTLMIVTRYVFSNVLATHIYRPRDIEIHLAWLGFGIEKFFINTALCVLAKKF